MTSDAMSNELPRFRKVKRGYAASIVQSVLSGPGGSALLQLVEFDDNHFRVVFDIKQFNLVNAGDLPSKSQWNTLKKRLKRRDRSIFIFREYGQIDCAAGGKRLAADTCLYLDFAFLYK